MNRHLADLAAYSEEEGITDDNPADQLLDEEIDLEASALPKRIIGSEDPDDAVEGDPPDEGVDPNAGDMQDLLTAVRSESAGRLNEIASMRAEKAESSATIASLREMFMEMERKNAQNDADAQSMQDYEADLEEYGEEVMHDPTVRYISEQVSRIDDSVIAAQQQQEHYRQTVARNAQAHQQQVQYHQHIENTVGQQEATFIESQPDYYDAYNFARDAREKMYTGRGYDANQAKQMVAEETMYLVREQVERGGSVPEQVYAMAKQWGYQSGNEAVVPAQQQSPGTQQIDLGRIKQGLASQGVGQIPDSSAGNNDSATTGEMTAAQFFSTVPSEKRLQIFMDDPDAFERLGRTGRITVT